MGLESLHDVKVLLVDDDEDDYILTKKIFDQIPNQPFILEWAGDYDTAINRISDNEHDIYLIDYRLGAHTGLDVLKFAKPQSRLQPFILLTGVEDSDIEWRSLNMAASDYLVKGSFDANTLSRTLYYALQRKSIERQRVEYLIELNRTKDEFISIASHQLRTPATGVKQYLGMVIEGFAGEVPEQQRSLLERAYESNERQLRIIADLLRVAQADSGTLRLRKVEVDFNILLEDVLAEQADTIAIRKQQVKRTFNTELPQVKADADALRMVLENIVDNASKYSHEGSTIEAVTDADDTHVWVTIRDEGVGIDREGLPRLFEKFARIDNPLSTKVGGSGLGLYWAKKIIDMHDGRIEYKPNVPKGTQFNIILPRSDL